MSADVIAQVKTSVDADRAVPGFTAPGDPLDVSKLRGKKMFVIPQAANAFNQHIVDAMKKVASDVGIAMTVYPNQGQTSQWVQGMNSAIAQKVDLIVLSAAPDPRVLQPQIQQAKAAGIPVLVTHFYDTDDPNPPDCLACAAGVTGVVKAPFNRAGKDEADWIIADSGGKAHVLIVGATEDIVSDGIEKTMKAEYQKWCPDTCKFKVILIPVSDWNTKVQSQVSTELNSDPSLNYVDVMFDAMAQGAVQAVNTVGGASRVKVVSFNGSTAALSFIQQKQVMAMDVGESVEEIGYADMDQAFRLMLNLPTVEQKTAIRVFDSTNVSEAGTPPDLLKGYGDAYVDGFHKLWGMS